MIHSALKICAVPVFFAFFAFSPAVGHAGPETVLKTELDGMEGMEANVVRFNVEPGWEAKRHMHPGHVFLYVTEGAIVLDMDGSEPQTISAGEAVYELPDTGMIARTATTTEGAEFIVFQVGATGKPLMVGMEE